MKTPQELVEQAKQNIQEISVEQARQDCSNHQIIDVREAGEYQQGHLPNAINISRGVLEFKIAEYIENKETPILVYCKTGGRAALAAQALGQLGYGNVISIAGGYEAWVASGNPIHTPENINFY